MMMFLAHVFLIGLFFLLNSSESVLALYLTYTRLLRFVAKFGAQIYRNHYISIRIWFSRSDLFIFWYELLHTDTFTSSVCAIYSIYEHCLRLIKSKHNDRQCQSPYNFYFYQFENFIVRCKVSMALISANFFAH